MARGLQRHVHLVYGAVCRQLAVLRSSSPRLLPLSLFCGACSMCWGPGGGGASCCCSVAASARGGGASCCHHAVNCRCTSAFVQPAQCRCVLVVRGSVGPLCLVIHESWQWLLLLGWRCTACSFIRMECASSSYQPLLHVHTCITNCLRPCPSFTVHRGASLEGVT